MSYNKQNNSSDLTGSRVEVRGDNLNQAMRVLKKKLMADGLMREIKERSAYEKPSMTRKKKKAAAKKRWEKSIKLAAEK
jgi:small subunit ribosomal protein S21